MKNIIVSGGGTGGHIYPALAIAQGLKLNYDCRILYMGANNSMEQRLAEEAGFEFAGFEAKGLTRHSFKIIGDAFTDLVGLGQAGKIIKHFNADLAIGTGGFASAPALGAAELAGVPVLLHEQNAVPGWANKLLAKKAQAICLTFEAAGSHFPEHTPKFLTGLPVRDEILKVRRKEARNYFGFDDASPVLLVTGGSQGAASINRAMAGAYKKLLQSGISIIHLTGNKNIEAQKKALAEQGLQESQRLQLMPYLNRMDYALGACDLVVGRAGASFLAEVMCVGVPSIIVPYPHAANNHQECNARSLEASNAAEVITDSELNADTLCEAVLRLLADYDKLKMMSKNAASMGKPDAVDNILEVAEQILLTGGAR
ncbi:MAG: undecaprenyldiphospho-muramoylpentapeptide beta-N-acetylglucosaminyltransferase [Firmicutes bacterium]|nr:undecaprenyldiphospho-muramoylpentapeptide beta-N-acetylglucosaminyltransferase [Bacillota bacterium]